MILTVAELRRFIETSEDDAMLEERLLAIETAIKGYTHNNFARVLENNGGEWPADIRMGVVDILKWKLKNDAANSGDDTQKAVQSETISRHSVTYAVDATESDLDVRLGFPKKYTAFLRPYMRARFGQGVRV